MKLPKVTTKSFSWDTKSVLGLLYHTLDSRIIGTLTFYDRYTGDVSDIEMNPNKMSIIVWVCMYIYLYMYTHTHTQVI